ncbi:hypothetical protein R2O95_14170, partial [Faecalibacterium duncaniae]|nr:hypothetical protein [Faecalibacterium duncaniae]
SKTMNEVSHLLANDDEETVHISANRRYVVFTTAGYTIMSRLIAAHDGVTGGGEYHIAAVCGDVHGLLVVVGQQMGDLVHGLAGY